MRNAVTIRLLIKLACFVPLAGGLALVNWIGEQRPVRQVLTASVGAAAEALVSGKTIASHIDTLDTLDLKPVWIERLNCRPEVVVLGSSRVAQIRSDWFRPRPMLNLAMLAGDFPDAVAIFQELLSTGRTPKLVLLELNPTLSFEGKNGEAPALAPYYRLALLHYGLLSPILLSGPLTMDALRWDPQVLLRRPLWTVAGALDRGLGVYRMHPDGSLDWYLTDSNPTVDDVEHNVNFRMHNLDPERQLWRMTSRPAWFEHKILLAFLDDLRARGTRVVVFLVPVHPTAYDFYARHGGFDDSWIRSEMAARGVTVIGAFSPQAAGVTREDFFDDVHAHPGVLHRLLAEGGIIK